MVLDEDSQKLILAYFTNVKEKDLSFYVIMPTIRYLFQLNMKMVGELEFSGAYASRFDVSPGRADGDIYGYLSMSITIDRKASTIIFQMPKL